MNNVYMSLVAGSFSYQDLGRCARVSKGWKALAELNEVWRPIAAKLISPEGYRQLNTAKGLSWKEYVKKVVTKSLTFCGTDILRQAQATQLVIDGALAKMTIGSLQIDQGEVVSEFMGQALRSMPENMDNYPETLEKITFWVNFTSAEKVQPYTYTKSKSWFFLSERGYKGKAEEIEIGCCGKQMIIADKDNIITYVREHYNAAVSNLFSDWSEQNPFQLKMAFYSGIKKLSENVTLDDSYVQLKKESGYLDFTRNALCLVAYKYEIFNQLCFDIDHPQKIKAIYIAGKREVVEKLFLLAKQEFYI